MILPRTWVGGPALLTPVSELTRGLGAHPSPPVLLLFQDAERHEAAPEPAAQVSGRWALSQ